MKLGHEFGKNSSESTDQRRGPAFGNGDLETALAASGCDFRSPEPGSDHQNTLRARV
jgi:hypothetical protein